MVKPTTRTHRAGHDRLLLPRCQYRSHRNPSRRSRRRVVGSFSIEHVRSIDNKTIDVAFDQTIGTELQNMVVAVPNALLRYVRISGGSGGQSDALARRTVPEHSRRDRAVVARRTRTRSDRLHRHRRQRRDAAGRAKYELWLDASNTPRLSCRRRGRPPSHGVGGRRDERQVTSVASLAVGSGDHDRPGEPEPSPATTRHGSPPGNARRRTPVMGSGLPGVDRDRLTHGQTATEVTLTFVAPAADAVVRVVDTASTGQSGRWLLASSHKLILAPPCSVTRCRRCR